MPDAAGPAFVARLDAAGAHLWSEPLARPSVVPSMQLATGSDGSVIVYGDFEQPLDFGGGVLTSEGSSDGFVVKLDAAGRHLFSRSFGGTGYHHGCGVAALASGGMAVAGSFEGELDADGPLSSHGESDVFVAKLDPGGAAVWRKSFGDAMDEQCSSLAVDRQGNVLLAGRFEDSIDFGGGPLVSEGDGLSSDDLDLFVAKLDEDGDHLWSLRIGADNLQGGPRVVSDADGNVIVATGVGEQLELFGEVVAGSEEGDLVVAKLDPGGNPLWHRVISGAGDEPMSLSVGAENIFVAGSKFDVFLATVSLDGSAATAEHFLSPTGEGSFGIAQSVTAAEGGVVMTGSFASKLDFGCGALEAQSGPDLFVAHLPEAR